MRTILFFLLLSACTNPSEQTGRESADSTAVVEPADKTAVAQDSLATPNAVPPGNQATIRADSL